MVIAAGYVYNMNQLVVLILNHHIWSPRRCFLSHPIFKVPTQFYIVIFYNRSLLLFQINQHWRFFCNPLLSSEPSKLYCVFSGSHYQQAFDTQMPGASLLLHTSHITNTCPNQCPCLCSFSTPWSISSVPAY